MVSPKFEPHPHQQNRLLIQQTSAFRTKQKFHLFGGTNDGGAFKTDIEPSTKRCDTILCQVIKELKEYLSKNPTSCEYISTKFV